MSHIFVHRNSNPLVHGTWIKSALEKMKWLNGERSSAGTHVLFSVHFESVITHSVCVLTAQSIVPSFYKWVLQKFVCFSLLKRGAPLSCGVCLGQVLSLCVTQATTLLLSSSASNTVWPKYFSEIVQCLIIWKHGNCLFFTLWPAWYLLQN